MNEPKYSPAVSAREPEGADRRELIRGFGTLAIGAAACMALRPSTAHATRVTVNPAGARVFGLFDVRDYGALGDGTGNDAPAFQAALTDIQSAGGGVLLVPPGVYRLLGPLSVSEVAVHIMGMGRDQSILRWEAGVTAGLTYTASGHHYLPGEPMGRGKSLQMSGLSLMTTQPSGGTAIRASWPAGATMDALFQINDVKMSGVSFTTSWTQGIWLTNPNGIKADNFYIVGNQTVSNNTLPNPWACAVGIKIDGATTPSGISHYFSNFGISRVNTGILVTNWLEGFYLQNFEIAYVGTGISVTGFVPGGAQSGNPNFFLSGGHINFRGTGCSFVNVYNPKLANVDLYKGAGDGQSFPGNAIGFVNSPNFSVVGCKLESKSPVGTNENGIFIQSGSNDGIVSQCQIQNFRQTCLYTECGATMMSQNVIRCGAIWAVYLSPASNWCFVRYNRIFATGGVAVVNSGANNCVPTSVCE